MPVQPYHLLQHKKKSTITHAQFIQLVVTPSSRLRYRKDAPIVVDWHSFHHPYILMKCSCPWCHNAISLREPSHNCLALDSTTTIPKFPSSQDIYNRHPAGKVLVFYSSATVQYFYSLISCFPSNLSFCYCFTWTLPRASPMTKQK